MMKSNPQEDDHETNVFHPNSSHPSSYSNHHPPHTLTSAEEEEEENHGDNDNEQESLLGVSKAASRYPAATSPSSSSLPRTRRRCPRGSFLCALIGSRYCTMHCAAQVVLWGTITSLFIAIVWYSYELFNHGTDPHLIAWFSAGAFVLLGFPIAMTGIIGHLTNYNAPHIQVYIVRILWMVPIYSIESWLAMRFHKQAVFIETARDVYESFVLYCFLQFLIQVLGGEEALILMLKDKSPTRGVHMCGGLEKLLGFRPWLMGQPVRQSVYTPAAYHPTNTHDSSPSPLQVDAGVGDHHLDDDSKNSRSSSLYHHHDDDDDTIGDGGIPPHRASVVERVTAALSPTPHPRHSGVPPSTTNPPLWLSSSSSSVPPSPNMATTVTTKHPPPSGHAATTTYYRVHWTSPFFIQCKFGVLQYVLIKLFCAMATLILEYIDWYHEGSFSYTSGYLYICILTNVSQCYALYCLIFFYYATKNELSPIRPVGKFISVKAIVFFTWWQSVLISVLYQMDMIPNYKASNAPEKDWNSEDVAKGIQDYLICIEMFVAAIVHSVVFPHSEYSLSAVRARDTAMGGRSSRTSVLDGSGRIHTKRLGRRRHRYNLHPPPAYLYHHHHPTGGDHDDEKPSAEEGASSRMKMPGDVELTEVDDHRTVDSNDDDHGSLGTWGSRDSAPRPQGFPSRPPIYDVGDSEDEPVDVEAPHPPSSSSFQSPPGSTPSHRKNRSHDQDSTSKPGLLRAFIDSAIPRDLHDNTVDLLLQRGDFLAGSNKKTLLHHAATSDQYDLFAKNSIAKASRRYNQGVRSSSSLHSATTKTATSSLNTKRLPPTSDS